VKSEVGVRKLLFADLDVRFPVSRERMQELGFGGFRTPFVAELSRPGDARRIPKCQLAVASSQDVALLREAARSPRVQLLCNKAFVPDVGLIRDAAERGKAFEIPVAPVLHAKGFQRSALMGRMRFFLKLCLKMRAPFAIVSQAACDYSLKSPQELCAFGCALGLSRDQAEWAVAEAAEGVLDASG
jgi:RNase P/RNase MRP subunit p30